MAFPAPAIDQRSYREVLDESLARVPVHTPEWTNLNDSDPGVTLLQLFAFMTESIIYRTNRIPERNRAAFLRLLGLPLRAAQPASGLVALSNPKGALEPVPLEADQSLFAGKVPFRTETGLDVLPIEARLYYKKRIDGPRRAEIEPLYRRLYASVGDGEVDLDFYETRTFAPLEAGVVLPSLNLTADTVDGLWLALLARTGETPDAARDVIANRHLSLGILPSTGVGGCALYPNGARDRRRPTLLFERPNATTSPPRYEQLIPSGGDDPLAGPGVVTLPLPGAAQLRSWQDLDPQEAGVGTLPPSLEETDDQARLITWVRLRLADSGGAGGQPDVRISWVGINAARVVQRAHVPAETLPDGTGEPDQTARLVNTPVMPESVSLTVGGEVWRRVETLGAAPPEIDPQSPRLAGNGTARPRDPDEAKVYTVDRASGEVRFGSGLAGMRPQRGAAIQAAYDYGGGPEGAVGIGSITKSTTLPTGIKVINAVPTWGGGRAETVAEAERRIPTFLHHRDRLVAAADIHEITWQTPGVELGRVEVLSLVHPTQPTQISPGVVTVLVIPRTDPVQPEAPRPEPLFLETVCRHLEPRRVLTTELHVRGPVYVPVWVTIGIDVVPGEDEAPVRERVRAEITRFLSPLEGGFERQGDGAGRRGWPLHKLVEALEILTAAARVTGVAKVNGVRLGDQDGAERQRIEITGLQLPHLQAVSVGTGDAPDLAELVGGVEPPEPGEGRPIVPVPVVPEEC